MLHQLLSPHAILLAISLPAIALGQVSPKAPKAKKAARPVIQVEYPPTLPGGKEVVTDQSALMLKPPETLRADVSIAKTPPKIDFMYYPGQTYPGNPWANWGDSIVVGGKYYASIGDHLSPSGNAFVYEYDGQIGKLRQLVDVKKLLNLPEGHYTPGKIHGRVDAGSDGWLYFSTYRGGMGTTDEFHYQGDWILRVQPTSGRAEVVAQSPIPKHGIPGSRLDPERMIFYGGTTAGSRSPRDPAKPGDIQFFAYDLKSKKLLYSGPKRQKEYIMWARSTGRAYYVDDQHNLMRFDPSRGGSPLKVAGPVLLTGAATDETPQGYIYSVGGESKAESYLWALNTKTEALENLGPVAVGVNTSVSSLDADPTGKYIYYTLGTHGSSPADGTPVVQFNIETKKKKVLAFLHPYYQDKYQCSPVGSYSSALDVAGEKLYVTWNVRRGSKAWDCCALTVIHIPPEERP